MPDIVAHRGASYDAPENTLASFHLGWQQQADALEGDFHLTADGRIVCMHDAATGRTGDCDLTIKTSTFDQLRQVDVGLHKGARFAGLRIPTLAEVLATVPPGKKVFLELKATPAIVGPFQAELDRLRFPIEQVMVISFDTAVLAEVKRQMPGVKTAWLCGFVDSDGPARPTIAEILAVLRDIRADGLDCHAHPSIDRAFAAKLRQGGMSFNVWTVDKPEIALRFTDLGVDSITTNRPGFIRQALGKS
jgi:glycerophosphoryl diester phosphodiesterase